MGIKVTVNSDKELADEIRMAISENDGYCCCAIEKTDDTKCMCKEFRERIQNKLAGECHCGLYTLEVTDD